MTLQMYKRLSLFAIHFEKNNRKKVSLPPEKNLSNQNQRQTK